jgi:hypothetical protein
MQNTEVEPQKSEHGFEIRRSLFDILRFISGARISILSRITWTVLTPICVPVNGWDFADLF